MKGQADHSIGRLRHGVFLVILLRVVGTVVALAGTLVGIFLFSNADRSEKSEPLFAFGVIFLIAVAWGLGAGLWTLAQILQPRRAEAGSIGEPSRQVDVKAGRDTSRQDTQLLGRILETLNEINATILLSPEQREIERRRRQRGEANEIASGVESDLDAEDFERANDGLGLLRKVYPGHPRCDELQARLDKVRAAALARQLEEKKKLVADLMAVAEFTRAKEVARELLREQPASVEAIALLDRVKREADTFFQEQRRRMYGQIEQHVEARKWPEAVASARRFLDAFPETREAQLVCAQMPTLEENARIAEVRTLRDEIRSLLERHRYSEAMELAGDVVERFPGTAAAEELRKQMPRLEKLAGDGGKA